MDLREAIRVAEEMQRWRRSEPPYDADGPLLMPYPPRRFGEALDALLAHARRDAPSVTREAGGAEWGGI